MQRDDQYYMRKALEMACKAESIDEVPIGAIVVDADGAIIGRGYNQVERKKTQLAHAEIIALERATRKKGDWRLDGCILYVTLEPCRMCVSLIQISRLRGIIYAAESPRFGYQLDNIAISSVYKKDVQVKGGVGADDAQRILKQFFQKKRKKKDGCKKAQFGGNQGCIDTASE